MRECDNCGAPVTPAFVRVFGDNDGELSGCPNCTAMTDLMGGFRSDRRTTELARQ